MTLPINPTKPYASQVVVGFRDSNRVQILSIINSSRPFKHICSSKPYSSVPRSVSLHNFGTSHDRNRPEYRPYLMVWLANGRVASCDVDGRPPVFACGNLGEVYHLCYSVVMIGDLISGSHIFTSPSDVLYSARALRDPLTGPRHEQSEALARVGGGNDDITLPRTTGGLQ